MIHDRQSRLFFGLALTTALVLAGGWSDARSRVGAQSGQEAKGQTPKTGGKEEEPVAITARTKEAPPVELKPLAVGQFANFGAPSTNRKGDVVFLGRYITADAPGGSSQAIFLKTAEGKWQIIRPGDRAENLTEAITGFSNPTLNDRGEIAFIAPIGTPGKAADGTPLTGASNTGVFIKTAAGLKSLNRHGQEVPNMPSHFSGFANVSSNSKGAIAFVGTYSDPDGKGLFIYDQGGLRLVVRSGQKIAPGATEVFSEHYYPATLNERGEIAFFSRISGGGGVFVYRPGGVEPVAVQGKPSPIAEANYLGFGNRAPAINDKGEVVFPAFYDGPNAGRGLFIKSPDGPVRIVAKSGDTIPGTSYTLSDFLYPAINERGEIAFYGNFGGRSRGIFLKTAKGIEVVALAEQQVPGAEKGEIFNHFTAPALNDRGEVIFYAQYKSGAGGIFIKDATGLKPLMVRGDSVPIK